MEKKTHTIPFKDVDQYIAAQPLGIQATLQKLRLSIQKAVPKAQEVISYQMPAYKYHGMVVYFAAFKKHYSFFVRPSYLNVFRPELGNYKTSKSAVNIPLEQKVPVGLITRIVKFAAKQNEENAKLKHKKKTTNKKSKP